MLAAAAALAVTLPLLPPEAPAEPPQSETRLQSLFPIPTAGFTIPGGEDAPQYWSLHDLLTEFSKATNLQVLANRATDSVLKRTQVRLAEPLTVPPSAVYTVTESILINNDVFLSIVHAREPRILSATSLITGELRHLQRFAHVVPHDQLAAWTAHPAVLITTILHLPNTDTRSMTTTLRSAADTRPRQIMPLGASQSVLLRGLGPEVASLAFMLKEADEVAGRARAEGNRVPSETPATGGDD